MMRSRFGPGRSRATQRVRTLGHDEGWPAWTWVCLVACLPVVAFTLAWERRLTRRGGEPLLDLPLFSDRAFSAGIAVNFALVFLPSGEAALTRRAKKASGLSAVVVRWSRTRKRYERQGLLVEEAALEQAEQQCLADEDARTRRRCRPA